MDACYGTSTSNSVLYDNFLPGFTRSSEFRCFHPSTLMHVGIIMRDCRPQTFTAKELWGCGNMASVAWTQ